MLVVPHSIVVKAWAGVELMVVVVVAVVVVGGGVWLAVRSWDVFPAPRC
jgi:hypothetical protein